MKLPINGYQGVRGDIRAVAKGSITAYTGLPESFNIKWRDAPQAAARARLKPRIKYLLNALAR